MQETWVWSLSQGNPLEDAMATHSCILAQNIPCTEESRGLQSMGSHRVKHDCTHPHMLLTTNDLKSPEEFHQNGPFLLLQSTVQAKVPGAHFPGIQNSKCKNLKLSGADLHPNRLKENGAFEWKCTNGIKSLDDFSFIFTSQLGIFNKMWLLFECKISQLELGYPSSSSFQSSPLLAIALLCLVDFYSSQPLPFLCLSLPAHQSQKHCLCRLQSISQVCPFSWFSGVFT